MFCSRCMSIARMSVSGVVEMGRRRWVRKTSIPRITICKSSFALVTSGVLEKSGSHWVAMLSIVIISPARKSMFVSDDTGDYFHLVRDLSTSFSTGMPFDLAKPEIWISPCSRRLTVSVDLSSHSLRVP